MMSLHRYCAWLAGLVLTLSYVFAVAQNTIELQPDKGLLVIDGHPFVLEGSTVIGLDYTVALRPATGAVARLRGGLLRIGHAAASSLVPH